MNFALSGLLNLEVTTRTRGFPINYYPIDYPFFGVNLYPGGVAFNVAKALKTLGDEVGVYSFIGEDDAGALVKKRVRDLGLSTKNIYPTLPATPMSTILYDETGRRQIYCDLKDIQMRVYPFKEIEINKADIVVATNINFSRSLLPLAKKLKKTIATDVQVLSSLDDEFNQEFMKYADILFFSDEAVPGDLEDFVRQVENKFHNKIIVVGRGGNGSLLYEKKTVTFTYQQAYHFGEVKNTVGAGDSFFASFLHFYAKGESPKEALALASAFAGLKVLADGASNGFVNEDEVRKALERVR